MRLRSKYLFIKGFKIGLLVFWGIIGIMLTTGFMWESDNNPCVWLSDEGYYYMKNVENENSPKIKISDFTYEGELYYFGDYFAHITEDGKYCFFINRVEEGTGTLYRAELDQMTEDIEKNKDYIIKVASDVSLDKTTYCKDGTVVYGRKDTYSDGYRMYYFDGLDSYLVDDKVWCWETFEDVIFYLRLEDEDEVDNYTLYGANTKLNKPSVMIASDVTEYFYVRDMEHVVYSKYYDKDDSSHVAMYVAGYTTEPRRLSSNMYYDSCYQTFEKTGTFYYTEMEEVEFPLNNFVDIVSDQENSNSQIQQDLEEYLENTTYTIKYYSLYYYTKDGKVKQIASRIANNMNGSRYSYSNGHVAAAFFQLKKAVPKMSLDSTYYSYDTDFESLAETVREYVDDNIPDFSEFYYSIDGEEAYAADSEVWGMVKNADILQLDLYNEGNNALIFSYRYDDNGDIISSDVFVTDVIDGKLQAPKTINLLDNVSKVAIIDDHLMYNHNEKICFYVNGENIETGVDYYLISDAPDYLMTWYEDGSGIVTIAQDGRYGKSILWINTEGEKVLELDEVTDFCALENEDILYLSDDNLEYYNIENKWRIDEDVEIFWCLNQKKIM